jgi:hypothetical protein
MEVTFQIALMYTDFSKFVPADFIMPSLDEYQDENVLCKRFCLMHNFHKKLNCVEHIMCYHNTLSLVTFSARNMHLVNFYQETLFCKRSSANHIIQSLGMNRHTALADYIQFSSGFPLEWCFGQNFMNGHFYLSVHQEAFLSQCSSRNHLVESIDNNLRTPVQWKSSSFSKSWKWEN